MAPKTFIFLALVLSGVFTINIPVVCSAQSAEGSGINIEKQVLKVLAAGPQLETKQVVKIPLKYRRNAISYISSRAMYADNTQMTAADEKQG